MNLFFKVFGDIFMKDNVNIAKLYCYLKHGETLALIVHPIPDAVPVALILLADALLSLELKCSNG